MGSGDGELREPAGVAVRESTGEVFVADRGNDRVAQFRPRFGSAGEVAGEEFVAVWGWGVKDGEERFERCASGCRARIPGASKGALRFPEAIAVDNSKSSSDPSAGDVYVGTSPKGKHVAVEKFTPDGELALGKMQITEEGTLDGVAVDSGGNVWVYRGEEEAAAIERFSNAVKNVREQGAELLAEVECPKPGFALAEGSEGFYLDYEGVNFEDTCASETGSRLRNVVAGKVGGEGEVLLSALDPQETGGLAVEPASGVNVYNGSLVGAFDPSGSLIRVSAKDI